LVRALGNSRSRAQTEREHGKAAEVRTCVHLITPDGGAPNAHDGQTERFNGN
jgi:hypothetical protein